MDTLESIFGRMQQGTRKIIIIMAGTAHAQLVRGQLLLPSSGVTITANLEIQAVQKLNGI
jgi:hypothetical protein